MTEPSLEEKEESFDYWTFDDVIETIDEHQMFVNIRWDPISKF